MDPSEMRRRVTEARVARLATIDDNGRVHLVPIVFVLDGDTFYSSTDEKPRAKRLKNIERDPNVDLLVDHYDEDWSRVWWVRLGGPARILEEGPERLRA